MAIEKQPIINCHTHIFTGDHVPPYLAKTVVPAPLYFLINLSWVVGFFRFYHKIAARISYSPQMKRFELLKNKVRIWINKLECLSAN